MEKEGMDTRYEKKLYGSLYELYASANHTGHHAKKRGNICGNPRASLYRHIKVLLDAKIITVVKEEFKRGSVEKTYAIAPQMPYDNTNEEYNSLIQSALMGLQGDFYRYFNGDNPDPQRDLLTVGSASLMMSDEEMMEFIKAYGNLLQKDMSNKPVEGRKVRKVTLVISPKEQ